MLPRNDTIKPSIAATGAETLVLKLTIYTIGFVGSIVVSRALGPESRGMYYLPVVAAATTVVLGKLGLEYVNIYMLGTRGIAVARLAAQNSLVALSMGSIGIVIMLQARSILPSIFGATPLALLALSALSVPFYIHQQFSAVLLNLQGKVTWQFRASLVSQLIQLAALVVLALLGRLDPFSVLAITLVISILSWAFTNLGFDDLRMLRPRWDPELLRETMASSLVIHLATFLWFLHSRLDTFMIQGMIGSMALGLYSVAVTVAESMQLAGDSLAVSVRPRQVGGSLGSAAILTLRAARMTVLIGLGLCVAWALGGFLVIRIFYGAEFTPAYAPLLALLPGMVALGVQRCAVSVVLRAGLPWRYAGIYAACLACNVVANLFLIPAFGITGAGAASSISYSAEALLFLAWTASLAGRGITEGLVPQRSDLERLRGAVLDASFRLARLFRGTVVKS